MRALVTPATACTARSKASAFAREGRVNPLTLRTYCRAAARTSSSVAGGSKLKRVRMLRHMTSPPGQNVNALVREMKNPRPVKLDEHRIPAVDE
jgi:hypothetical protein